MIKAPLRISELDMHRASVVDADGRIIVLNCEKRIADSLVGLVNRASANERALRDIWQIALLAVEPETIWTDPQEVVSDIRARVDNLASRMRTQRQRADDEARDAASDEHDRIFKAIRDWSDAYRAHESACTAYDKAETEWKDRAEDPSDDEWLAAQGPRQQSGTALIKAEAVLLRIAQEGDMK